MTKIHGIVLATYGKKDGKNVFDPKRHDHSIFVIPRSFIKEKAGELSIDLADDKRTALYLQKKGKKWFLSHDSKCSNGICVDDFRDRVDNF